MTDTELKQILDESESFWRQVAIDNHRVPVDRPKRKRPECLNPKPHIRYNQGQWECDCYVMYDMTHHLYTAATPRAAYQQLVNAVNHSLDWDQILAGNFIYIDVILARCPRFVFDLLPPAIQTQYL